MYKRKNSLQKVKTSYVVISSEVLSDGTTAESYGIGVVQNDILVNSIGDISMNREKIEQIVFLCNTEDLDPCHLQAIAEDAVI